MQAWELYFPILLEMNAATKDTTRTDKLIKVMAESFMPLDEGLADRCYYIPGRPVGHDEIIIMIDRRRFRPWASCCIRMMSYVHDGITPAGFHYCALTLTQSSMFLGACVPMECQYQEVIDSVMPEWIQTSIHSYGTCGRADYSWTPFRIFMVTLTAALVVLVLASTLKDLVRLRPCISPLRLYLD